MPRKKHGHACDSSPRYPLPGLQIGQPYLIQEKLGKFFQNVYHVLPMPGCLKFHQLSSLRGFANKNDALHLHPPFAREFKEAYQGAKFLGYLALRWLSVQDKMTGWNEPSRSRRALVDSESCPKQTMASSQLTHARTGKQGDDSLNQALLTSAPQSAVLDQTIGSTGPTQPNQCAQQGGVAPLKLRHTPLGPTKLDLSKLDWILKMDRSTIFRPRLKKSTFPLQTEI